MSTPRCSRCGHDLRAGLAFCPHCGATTAPSDRDDPQHPRHPPWAMVGLGTVLLLVAATVVVLVLRPTSVLAAGGRGDHSPTTAHQSPTTTDDSPTGADPRSTPATATASCVRPPGQDAGGNVSSYGPENVLDNKPDTAWRCDGDGSEASLTITFAAPVRITEIGLIPGFAKTDPYDGTDRYAQNDRISAATLAFEDGDRVSLQLDTSLTNRRMQVFRFAPQVSRQLVIAIAGSVPGQAVNGQPSIDAVAISEVEFG